MREGGGRYMHMCILIHTSDYNVGVHLRFQFGSGAL